MFHPKRNTTLMYIYEVSRELTCDESDGLWSWQPVSNGSDGVRLPTLSLQPQKLWCIFTKSLANWLPASLVVDGLRQSDSVWVYCTTLQIGGVIHVSDNWNHPLLVGCQGKQLIVLWGCRILQRIEHDLIDFLRWMRSVDNYNSCRTSGTYRHDGIGKSWNLSGFVSWLSCVSLLGDQLFLSVSEKLNLDRIGLGHEHSRRSLF